MEMGQDSGCPCGSAARFEHCCGAPLPRTARAGVGRPRKGKARQPAPSSPRPPSPGPGMPPLIMPQGEPVPQPGGPERPELLAAIVAVESALQEPSGDVAGALAALAPVCDPLDPSVLELCCQVLLHGQGDELLAFLYEVVPRPDGLDHVLDGQSLRLWAGELLLLRLARLDDGVRRMSQVARFLEAPVAELRRHLEAHHRLSTAALQRQRYRMDRTGLQVVPLTDELLRRFTFLLVSHWGWPDGRAVLARREIERLLMTRFDPGFLFDGLHACRDCALLAPARRDLGRGATALAVDVNAVILGWPQLMQAVGGPFRGAALLEALPLWLSFLESLQLVESKSARTAQAMLARSSRMLAPTLLAAVDDRALAAAATRLQREPAMAA